MGGALPQQVIDEDGAVHQVFPLPVDAASLEELLRDLFQNHWRDIVFGPIIQGAAWEMRAERPPETVGMLDGYLTVGFGAPHFHVCIGEHRGSRSQPVSPELAQHRRTARAEMYRRLSRAGTPVSWGVRLFNGKGEQQITILLPNPFLEPATDKILAVPDWSRLALWDRLRARWFGLNQPDPADRSGRGFTHD